MIKNTNLCNNCGKQGHSFHQCKLPITSYGIVLFRSSSKGLQFLMIRRKDSFGFINEMSLVEKQGILTKTFDELWLNMWGNSNNIQYKNEELSSSKKMETIRNGVIIKNDNITLRNIV